MTARSATPQDMNDPRQAAQSLYGAGIQLGEDGSPRATRDFGSLLGLNSSQMNALSRGAKPGSFSSLGQPTGSMYANNPGFFRNRLRQRNQTLVPGAPAMSREQRVAQAQSEGTFDTIRDRYNTDNAGAGLSMNEFGNINKVNPLTQTQAAPLPSYLKRPAPSLDPDTPGGASAAARSKMMQPRSVMGALTKGLDYNPLSRKTALESQPSSSQATTSSSTNTPANQQEVNRAGLEDRAAGLRLLREMSQTPLQIDRKAGGGADTLIRGKYGEGFAGNLPPGVKRPAGYEGDVNGRPFSEVMTGLANKQVREGTWRKGDRLPEGMTEKQALSESEKARQSRQSLQRLTKR
jgi:hypothetical protein